MLIAIDLLKNSILKYCNDRKSSKVMTSSLFSPSSMGKEFDIGKPVILFQSVYIPKYAYVKHSNFKGVGERNKMSEKS